MNRRRLSLFLALTLLLLLTGCWDRRELNELAISVAVGIDKVDRQYQVTVQVVKPGEFTAKKGGNGGSAPVTMYQAKGATIFEAIRRMGTVSPRKIYTAHLRIAVFGEELAREGIGDALDLLSRNYEFRTDFYLLIAKGTTAAHVLDILTPLEKIPANQLFGSIETSEKVWAPVMAVTLDKFVMDYESKGKNPVLSGIRVSGDDEKGGAAGNLETVRPAAELRNTGLAVFRNDQLIGWLNETESKGYNYIINNVSSTAGHVACPQGGNVALEVISSIAKMTGSVQNGRPRLAVELRVEQSVGEVQCRIDLTQVKAVQDLEQRAEQSFKETLERSIEAAQSKYKTDFFGFGNVIHRSDPGAWKSLETEWDKLFVDAVVDVTVKVEIKRTGTLTNSFLEEGRK
jgi:spore germination protein KC